VAETVEWPYDADEHDPLTKLRIPVVGSAWPRWYYIVAFDSGRLDDETFRPTDLEAAMLRSYLDHYIARWHGESFKAKHRKRPFDIDGGANGLIFRKWGEGDWAYRRRSWQMGPTYFPMNPQIRARQPNGNPLGPLSLAEVMDHTHTVGDEPMPHWLEWKAAHPEVFGGAR
jgi:hypothetical protein